MNELQQWCATQTWTAPVREMLAKLWAKTESDVVAYDLSDQQSWDLVPYAQPTRITPDGHKNHIRQLNNSWWLSHRLLQSQARVVYGSIYEVPEAIGPVDVAAVVRAAVDVVRPAAEAKRIAVDEVIDGSLGKIAADADRLIRPPRSV